MQRWVFVWPEAGGEWRSPEVSECMVLEEEGTGLPSALLWEWRVCITQNLRLLTVPCLLPPKVTREKHKEVIRIGGAIRITRDHLSGTLEGRRITDFSFWKRAANLSTIPSKDIHENWKGKKHRSNVINQRKAPTNHPFKENKNLRQIVTPEPTLPRMDTYRNPTDWREKHSPPMRPQERLSHARVIVQQMSMNKRKHQTQQNQQNSSNP